MNILLINYEYPPIGGGAATATQALATAFHGLGHATSVLTAGFPSQRGESFEDGNLVIRLPSRRSRLDRSTNYEKISFVAHAALELPRLLRRIRPHACLVFFSMPCGPLGRLAHALSGVPYVVSLRGGDVPGTEPALGKVHTALTPIRRWVLRGAVAVVANSGGLKSLSAKADPVAVVVIPNGVDTSVFLPGPGRPRQEYSFLFVGRLNTQKNVALLLAAAQKLKAEAAYPFRIKIVGDGPLAGDLHTEAESRGLSDVIDWQTWISREAMPSCVASADCLVNPSLYEGMPNCVLEAMSCGLPVIASDVAGNADLVTDARTGLLFRSEDSAGLAAAMRRVLEGPDAAAAWGRAGREIVERQYSWTASARGYLDLFPSGKAA